MLTEMYPTQTAANVNTSVHKLIAKLQAEAQAHALATSLAHGPGGRAKRRALFRRGILALPTSAFCNAIWTAKVGEKADDGYVYS